MELSKALKRRKQDKVGKVLDEFKTGALRRGGSGGIVKNHRIALAIALAEAGLSKKR